MATVGRSNRRSPDLAWLLTGPLAVFALALAAVIGLRENPAVGEWPLSALFLGLFVLADLFRLTFEVRRQTFVLTLAEIPLLLSLYHLPP